MGYLGIKRIFDLNKGPYAKRTIIQASDLKEKLESLNLRVDSCTIVSIDAINYYPSIHLRLVQKAVEYCSIGLSKEAWETIENCLTMIASGMKSTLFTFQDVYYEYDGDADPDDRGLTIGGYESAWLANLVWAYLLNNTQHLFEESLFQGFYRDDGLFAVFNNTYSYSRLAEWRNDFQSAVNTLAEGDYLQFSLSIWLDSSRRSTPLFQFDQKVTVVTTPIFPYLNMELLWHKDDTLHFQVHLKPNQQLKYLNRDSTHTTACFRAIPNGVATRLAKLTTILPSNKNKSMEQLYPKHYEKLRQANLLEQPSLTLSQEYKKYKQSNTNEAKVTKLWRQRDKKRTVHFCIRYSRA
jgi:hypothetical protein